MVEFQPSAWSKGSYLNVAAHWLWSSIADELQVVLSFDYGGRVGSFISFESEDQFAIEAAGLVEIAAAESRRLEELLVSIDAIADRLISDERQANEARGGGHWGAFHAGVAAGLAGRTGVAKAMFNSVLAKPASPGSVLCPMAQNMSELVNDGEAFRRYVFGIVNQQRDRLKLPAFGAATFV